MLLPTIQESAALAPSARTRSAIVSADLSVTISTMSKYGTRPLRSTRRA
jgi:hypothetical protein